MKAFGLADEGASAATIEVPTPEAGAGEVRIRVHASSVNGTTCSWRRGWRGA